VLAGAATVGLSLSGGLTANGDSKGDRRAACWTIAVWVWGELGEGDGDGDAENDVEYPADEGVGDSLSPDGETDDSGAHTEFVSRVFTGMRSGGGEDRDLEEIDRFSFPGGGNLDSCAGGVGAIIVEVDNEWECLGGRERE
jgi:hypothetical protein